MIPVEDFEVSLSSHKDEIIVFGDPIHVDPDDLIILYRTKSLDDFLAYEARHGIGNYLLVHSEGGCIKVITSPGYCGGYYSVNDNEVRIGTTLRSVLPLKPQIDPFGICFMLTSHPKAAWGTMPMTTMFSDVYRIPPCSFFAFTETGIESRSYLLDGTQLGRPASFEVALNEVAGSYAAYYKRRESKPTLMFSGGVDSLVIYLALAEHMPADDIRVITLQTVAGRSKANGHERAVPVARNCGMSIEILPDNSLASESVLNAVASMSSQDIIGTRAPHLALCDHGISGHILHGQNMDSIVKTTMENLQFNANRGYLTDAILPFVAGHEERQHVTFLENLQSTEVYLSDKAFQKSSVKTFARMRHGISDPSPGEAGILRGLLTSQFANVLLKPKYPASLCKMLDAADREASIFGSFVGQKLLKPRTIADAARFHTYTALASKRLTTFMLPSGASVQFAAMAGPLVTYSIGRKKGMLEASQPKREVFAYAQRRAGMEYKKLAEVTADDRSRLAFFKKAGNPSGDKFVQNFRHLLDPDHSAILAAIPDTRIHNHIARIYKKTAKDYNKEASTARRLICLEMLLYRRSVEVTQVGLPAWFRG